MILGEITIRCQPWMFSPHQHELRLTVYERGERYDSSLVVEQNDLTTFFDTIMRSLTAEMKAALLRAEERERTSIETESSTSLTTRGESVESRPTTTAPTKAQPGRRVPNVRK